MTDAVRHDSPAPPGRAAKPHTNATVAAHDASVRFSAMALQRTFGNAAVGALLRSPPGSPTATLILQRGYDTDARAAIQKKSHNPFGSDGDFEKAWGILNAINMSDMMSAMESLDKTGDLSKLVGHPEDAKKVNLARLMVGVHAVRLKASGVDAAGLAKIAAEISAVGGEAGTVEQYLGSGPPGSPGLLTGVKGPDAAAINTIDAALNPASVSAPTTTTPSAPVPWDGDGTTPAHKAKAAALKRELTAALKKHLEAAVAPMRKRKAAPKLPMDRVEGAGKQSKRAVDDVFGSIATSAQLTSGQSALRSSFNFRLGADLFDISKVRTPDAADLANWMAETDPVASAVQRAHHFDKARGPEKTFLKTQVLAPFVAANKADLDLYDVFGFAITSTREQQVVTLPPVASGAKPSKDGTPPDGDRIGLWSEWQLLTHEYIHTLEHPGFSAAVKDRRALNEGFCEMFNKEVLTKHIPIAKADSDATLRGGVEGVDSSGKPFPGFKPGLVPNYSAGAYLEYLTQAERIRSATSPEAVRAAFFLGHVELIGLDPNGDKLKTPGSGTPSGPVVSVPKGITTVFELAVMTRTSTAIIVGANPGLKAGSPLPPSVVIPGCQLHTVIESTETAPSGRVVDHQSETGATIAKMYGLSVPDLQRANPGLNLGALAVGSTVLIPAR